MVLAAWVEKVERLVENHELRIVEQCCHNANLLFVASREVAYVLLLSHYLVAHEGLERLKTFVHLLLFHSRHLAYKLKILLSSKEVDEERVVDESASQQFPVLALCRIDFVRHRRRVYNRLLQIGSKHLLIGTHYDIALCSLRQIEHQAEQCGLAGTVIAHESQHLTIINGKLPDVNGSMFAETLFEIIELYTHLFCGKFNDFLTQQQILRDIIQHYATLNSLVLKFHLKEFRSVAFLRFSHFFGRSGYKQASTATSTFRSYVDNVVGKLYNIKIMFDYYNRVATVDKLLQHIHKNADVLKVESGCRLVEYV